MLTFREVSMALMLNESHNRVLSISIWGLWQTGNLGIAAAGAVVMVLTMGVLMVFTLRFAGSSALRQRRGG